MNYSENQHIIASDLSFAGILRDVNKSPKALQPIFEAFTNALEAIKDRKKQGDSFEGEIQLVINSSLDAFGNTSLNSLTINDNGIGFNENDFRRFNTFKETSKGYKNLGSGRIQYVHFFDRVEFKSTYREGDKTFERKFVMSKKKSFLEKNSIVLHQECKETQSTNFGSTVRFDTLIDSSNVYNQLDDKVLKEELLKRYISYICHNKADLPEIAISYKVQGELKGTSTIGAEDVPNIDKVEKIKIKYSKVSSSGKKIERIDKEEEFEIDAYKIDSHLLDSNDLKLVSKGEIVEDAGIELDSLSKKDNVNGYKYLFLVASDYIDDRDTNLRGELNIPTRENIQKNLNLFAGEQIFLEDIHQELNNGIEGMYPEIDKVKKNHEEEFQKLKEMFLLDDETAKNIKVSINDSQSKILEKFYEAEAKKTAIVDAKIKESFDKLSHLDTTSDEYPEDFEKEIEKLVKSIPLQNKNALTHYVARRKLVLELFDKILKRKLKVQEEDGEKKTSKKEEALIHNLLFQQGSDRPEDSDLWIINEDFIYFKGSSEKRLSLLQVDGAKVFKDEFSVEEEKYLKSLGENRIIRRPDVLLFPEEGKCIILEFKAPDVNASDYLTQIDFYASLIRNYTNEEFQITTFYGYLIGENIEPRDVLGRVSRYEHSYQFDYIFRPSEKVNGFDGRSDGSIYTEVLKYTTLLDRAMQRNKIFIEKLK